MKFELTNDDVLLIVKALNELEPSALNWSSKAAQTLAVQQRIKQIKAKLDIEDK